MHVVVADGQRRTIRSRTRRRFGRGAVVRVTRTGVMHHAPYCPPQLVPASYSSTSTTMTSPSRPFDIPSPRQAQSATAEGTPPVFGTPSSASPSPRFLRAQYTGTPPVPNIPPRSGATPIGTPRTAQPFLPGPAGEPSSSSPRLTVGGISARRPSTPASGQLDNPFDDLTDEDKARVLRRHLVSREELQNNRPSTPDQVPGSSSRRGSDTGNISHRSSVSMLRPQREDTEPFPVPYDAPGADIT